MKNINLLFWLFAREFLALCIGVFFGAMFGNFIVHSSEEKFIWHPIPRLEDFKSLREYLEQQSNIWVEKTYQENHRSEDSRLAKDLFENIKFLCLIMTVPEHHGNYTDRPMHIKNTWGKKCNYKLFISTKYDPDLPTLPILENKKIGYYSWKQTQIAYNYVQKYYLDKVDWILQCDDTTFVVLENLRYSLLNHDPLEPFYFGILKCFALSKEAVKRLVNIALINKTLCDTQDKRYDHYVIKDCLANVGVNFLDLHDIDGKEKFMTSFTDSYASYSSRLIFFHYIQEDQFQMLEYLIYHLRPYGISYNFSLPNVTGKKVDLHLPINTSIIYESIDSLFNFETSSSSY